LGLVVAAFAAACGANPGPNAATPTPSPSPTTSPEPTPTVGPAPATPLKAVVDAKNPAGNVVLTGGGCTGEQAGVQPFVYNAEGIEVPVDPGAPNPDGSWELRLKLAPGRYRISATCLIPPRTTVATYDAQELKVP
jgi:hypothetical protein